MSVHQPVDNQDSRRLLELINGYRTTCLIGTAVQIGLFEALRGGAVAGTQLATSLGADFNSLIRFVRALNAVGVLHLHDDMVELSGMGRLMLKGDFAFSDRAALAIEEYLPAWAGLQHSLRTGRPAFDEVFGVNAWRHRQDHRALGESFHRIMVDDQRQTHSALVDAIAFGTYRTIVDVGGGFGELLAEILTKYPSLHGTLFDQPWVVEKARSQLTDAAVAERCDFVGGSFFDAIPTGGEIYILQYILHDWDDEQCLQILRNCRAAMSESSRLLIVENALTENAEPDDHVTMLDLHMMAVLGGRERTVAEFTKLCAAAGFAVENTQKLFRRSLILTLKTNLTYHSRGESP